VRPRINRRTGWVLVPQRRQARSRPSAPRPWRARRPPGATAGDQTLADDGVPVSAATSPRQAAAAVRRVYQARTAQAGGTWNAYISVADAGGALTPAVDDKPTPWSRPTV
jgi:hypothetical protein